MSRTAESTQITKEIIADAMIELLQTTPFDKITVDKLTERAKVGRATYFRNFRSKEETITFKFVRMWERYAAAHDLKERQHFTLDNAMPFFEYNLSIRPIIETVYKAGLQDALFKSFFEIMLPPAHSDENKWYREKFYSYGLFGLLDGWVRREFKETPEEMKNKLISIVEETKP